MAVLYLLGIKYSLQCLGQVKYPVLCSSHNYLIIAIKSRKERRGQRLRHVAGVGDSLINWTVCIPSPGGVGSRAGGAQRRQRAHGCVTAGRSACQESTGGGDGEGAVLPQLEVGGSPFLRNRLRDGGPETEAVPGDSLGKCWRMWANWGLPTVERGQKLGCQEQNEDW